MRRMAVPAFRLGMVRLVPLRRVLLRLAMLGAAATLGSRAGAQAVLPLLPAVPRLQLVLPTTLAGVRREGPPWLSYWRDASVPREWRYVTDAELRLEVPTARLELGRLSISSQLETVPGLQRDCLPDCRGPEWSTSLRLKYDTGALGPLRQTGPQLQLQGARPPGNAQGRRLFGAGFGGKF